MRVWRKAWLAIMIVLAVAISISPAHGQVVEWTRQFGTLDFDAAYGDAVDATGVYVVGITRGTVPGTFDAFVRKYDLNGNPDWTQQFGNSYFAIANGVAVDATGVYVVGETDGALPMQTWAGGADAFIRKCDLNNGNEIWTQQFGTSNDDSAYNVAVDASGIYVVGITQGTLSPPSAGGVDAFVRKCDLNNGNEIWTRQFGTPDTDSAYHVAVDASRIYVVGYTGGALPQSFDAFIRTYDLNGNAGWSHQFGTGRSDVAYGVAVDATGVYIVGTTMGKLPGQTRAGGVDAFTRKYDLNNGTELWTQQFGTRNDDFAADVAVDSTGIYVVGLTDGALPGQTSAGSFDAFVLKMSLMPANGQKQDVLNQVNAVLPTASNHDYKKLKKAGEELTESLDPSLWIDGDHLQAKKGDKVFDEEKEAVKIFVGMLKDKDTAVPAAKLQSWIAALVQVDANLATGAINDAIALPGDAKKIDEAKQEMAKAADELAEGHFADAIEHYEHAWEKAQEAVK